MTVEAKCMNGHTFPVSADMVSVTKAGTSFKATCPQCGSPANLSHKKVIEVMGLKDNNEARALKERLAKEIRGNDDDDAEISGTRKTNIPPVTPPYAPEPEPEPKYDPEPESDDAMSREQIRPRFDMPEEEDDEYPAPEPRRTHENPTEIREMERAIRSGVQQPQQQSRRRHRETIDVMGSATSDKNEILRDVISATNMPEATKQKIYKFVNVKPEGLTPHELYTLLTYLNISNNAAMAVVRSYEFDLQLQEQEQAQERQIYGMLGAPLPGQMANANQFPGSVNPFPQMQQQSQQQSINPFLPPTRQPTPPPNPMQNQGSPAQQQSSDPNAAITMLLPLAQQNPAAFQMIVSNPMLLQMVQQNPMSIFQIMQSVGGMGGMPGMGMPGMMGQQPQRPSGVSREEVRSLVAGEMEEIKKMLSAQKPDREKEILLEELRENRKMMLELVMSQNQGGGDSNSVNPFIEQQMNITGALLTNLLENKSRDNTGLLLQAIEDLKKTPPGSNPGGLPPSIEGMTHFLRYQELMNQFEETRLKYRDAQERRAQLGEIVNTAAETVGESIASVIEHSVGGMTGQPATAPGMRPKAETASGGMRPKIPATTPAPAPAPQPTVQQPPEEPVAQPTVPPSVPAGVMTLKCLACGTPIYVPAGAPTATCPNPDCGKHFKVVTDPLPDSEVSQGGEEREVPPETHGEGMRPHVDDESDDPADAGLPEEAVPEMAPTTV